MKNKEPSLKSLIDDLNHLTKLGNLRHTVLGVQLYVEHYVNELVCELAKEPAKEYLRKYLSFPKKLEILEKSKILEKGKKETLLTLNSIRDALVHELVLSHTEIENKLKGKNFGFIYSWTMKDKEGNFSGGHLIDLEDAYKDKIKNHLDQLIISSVILVGILYHNLNLERGIISEEFIDVKIEKKEKEWIPTLIVKKKEN